MSMVLGSRLLNHAKIKDPFNQFINYNWGDFCSPQIHFLGEKFHIASTPNMFIYDTNHTNVSDFLIYEIKYSFLKLT